MQGLGRIVGGNRGPCREQDRAFVEAMAPTHALTLPEETFTHWRDEYLDLVEMK